MATLPDLISIEIERLADAFVVTKNPANAALAYSLARKHNRMVPDAVQAEIDRFIACIAGAAEKILLSRLIETPRTMFRESELYEAWRGHIANPIGALERETRDHWIFSLVQSRVERGMKVTAAQNAVLAFAPGVDIESIKRIWKRGKRAGW